MLRALLVAVVAVVLAVAGIGVGPAVAATPDFANYTYSDLCGKGPVTLKNGASLKAGAAQAAVFDAKVALEGDLDGSGFVDYLVSANCSTGVGSSSVIVPMRGTARGLRQLPVVTLDGVFQSARNLGGGKVAVDMLTWGSDDPRCCPTQQQVAEYSFTAKGLQQPASSSGGAAQAWAKEWAKSWVKASPSVARAAIRGAGLGGSLSCYKVWVFRADRSFGALESVGRVAKGCPTVWDGAAYVQRGGRTWKSLDRLGGTAWRCDDWEAAVSAAAVSKVVKTYLRDRWRGHCDNS